MGSLMAQPAASCSFREPPVNNQPIEHQRHLVMKLASLFFQFTAVLTASLLLSSVAAIGAPAQPITDVGVDVTFDFDGDGERDATYEHQGMPNGGDTSYYTVVFFLRPLSQLRLVQASKQQIDYRIGEQVSAASPAHVNLGGGNSVGLLAYDADSRFGPWIYYDTTVGSKNMFFTNKTEVLVGFRLTSLETGSKHHGWIRFTRPDSHFTSPFAVAGYDWNPLPNEPIGAGQPPVIPVQSAFTSEGQLRLQWPTEVASWVLESSPTLGPDAVWEPVPDVVGTEHLLTPPETDRFYRLRRA